MIKFRSLAAALALAALALPALGQTLRSVTPVTPEVATEVTITTATGGSAIGMARGVFLIDSGGEAVTVTGGKLDVNASAGGGGGDASAANQTSQITQETAINTVLGAKADAKSTATDTTSVSAMSVLKQISASVQAPPSQAVTNAGTFKVQGTPFDRGFEAVAASQTAQVMGGSGAIGDMLNGCEVTPATTSPGQVLFLDNATSYTVFTGGASSVSNLVPFWINWGGASASGAWKITTGANVSVVCFGTFS